jgi:hypothetical protein
MKSHARVAVIGGGVVGASVLYHLTKAGWRDVLLIERAELTSGSTWHAAGGMHTVNGDPNVAKLQQYTIQLYEEIERISGQSCGVHITGGIMLAGTRERLDWLKMAKARGRYLGMDLEIISVAEAALVSAAGEKALQGRHVRSHRGTRGSLWRDARLCKSAQIGGAEIVRHTRVVDLEAPRRRHLGCDHDRRQRACGARGQCRRIVGPRGGAHGGHRTARARHGAPIPDHRRHAGTEGQERTAALHRFRGRNLYSPGARRHAHGHLRTRRPCHGPRSARPGISARICCRTISSASPRASRSGSSTFRRWAGRHQEGGQWTVHICTGRQSA